jgi:hypothetical protein
VRYLRGFNRGSLHPRLEDLKTAADAGHKPAAYMLALCLYRRNSSAGDDAEAMRRIRQVEGEQDAAAPAAGGAGEGTPTPWKNLGCTRCRLDALNVANGVRPLADANGYPIEVRVAKPVVHGGLQCAGGNCGETAGRFRWEKWSVFCNEECRIHSECERFNDDYYG